MEIVSIITPVYNSSSFIEATADSVLNQTYTSWEWLLVDDCSDDNSWEILKKLELKDKRIKIFRNGRNLKSGKTRNFAIKKAVGRWIAFLDSDDIWHPDKLNIQINFMLKNQFYFSHTSYGYIDENGAKIKSTLHVNNVVTYTDLLKRTEISCLTAIYDAKSIGKYYMSSHSRKQDYALWLSILKDGYNSYGLDIELAYYRQVKNSATSKKYKLFFRHISFLMDTQGFGVFKSLFYTIYWVKNGIIRYYLK